MIDWLIIGSGAAFFLIGLTVGYLKPRWLLLPQAILLTAGLLLLWGSAEPRNFSFAGVVEEYSFPDLGVAVITRVMRDYMAGMFVGLIPLLLRLAKRETDKGKKQ